MMKTCWMHWSAENYDVNLRIALIIFYLVIKIL